MNRPIKSAATVPTPEFRDIEVEAAPPVVVIRINRPELHNACRETTLNEISAALRAADEDEGIRAVVLTGSGNRAFSAGADLKEMSAHSSQTGVAELMKGWWELIDVLHGMRTPVIASVRGFAVGGGTEIALACHIVIASETARFGLPEILRGHIPGAGGTVHLPRRIGEGPALYHLLTGEDIPAHSALAWGLAARVVPDERLEEETTALARHLAAQSRSAIVAIIESVRRGASLTPAAAIELERELCARLRGTDDFVEGFRAFIEKRPAQYGRKQ